MIVFGYYGTGKTSYCKNNPNCYDLDFEHFYHSHKDNITSIKDDYVRTAREKEKVFDIVFVNRFYPELNIDFGFIQYDYQICQDILKERKQGNFIPDKRDFNDISAVLFKEGIAVFLKKNEFIEDYDKVLMNKVIEKNEVDYGR